MLSRTDLLVSLIHLIHKRLRLYFLSQVAVSNTGLRDATKLRVSLPKDGLLSLVSLDENDSSLSSEIAQVLEPGKTVVFTLRFTVSATEPLVPHTGTIDIFSLETRSQLEYR